LICEARHPEHQNPDKGEYEDVHVEVEPLGIDSAGNALLSVAVAVFAGNTAAVAESGEAEPVELISAAAWDFVNAVDPTGVSDLISWAADIDP
jgi:hypothetical protein